MKHLLRVVATVLMYWGTRSLALKFDSFAIAYLGGIIALGLNMIIESCSSNNIEGLYLLFYFPKLKITKYQRFNYFFLFISQVIGVIIVSWI